MSLRSRTSLGRVKLSGCHFISHVVGCSDSLLRYYRTQPRDRGMISTQKMIQIDPDLAKLSEPEIEELRRAIYDAAQLAFEIYWTKKHGSNDLKRLLANSPVSGIVVP